MQKLLYFTVNILHQSNFFMVHIGNNIAKLRNFRRKTQKEMAAMLEITQPEYSRIEGKEHINDELLEKIATLLDYPTELISNLDDSSAQNVYQNEGNNGNGFCYITNPVDKIVELYERLLESERARIALLETELLDLKKKTSP